MSRNRNQRLGLVSGERIAVVSASRSTDRAPWILALACGHWVRFSCADAPKHIRCPTCLGRPVPQVEPVHDGSRSTFEWSP